MSKLEKSLDLERSAREVSESGVAAKVKEAEVQKEAELGQKIQDAEDRAVEAEGKVSGLEEKIADLKKQLETREAPEVVIANFQKSSAYADALAKAAAAEVMRCWNVAERHIKSDPTANAQSFVDLYIEGKNKIAAGKGEPEPYDGPSPSFLPPINPDQGADSDSSTESDPPADDHPAN